MPSQKNVNQVTDLQEKIKRSKSVVIFDYSGTSAPDQIKLRSDIKEAGGEMYVTKNKLIDIALGKGKVGDSLQGMNALLFSYQDAVSTLKKLFSFHNETEKLTIKQGFMDDKVLTPDEVENLSKLPSKQELIATLIARIQGPSYGLVNVLQANSRNLIQVLKAVSEK